MACGPRPKTGHPFDPDFEGPSEDDLERFGAEFVACPNCTSDVYDQATVCPTCGFVLGDTVELSDKKGLSPMVIGVVVALVVSGFLLINLF